uniref:hypothetical protein n=1 Tax=Micromonospora viridifaciens TaxID=1881 RepID=UPI0018D4DD55|nr:hypothetical protein [Micromonospora viridifaciens]
MATEITSGQEPAVGPVGAMTDEQLIAMLVDRARGDGLKPTGEGGLLQQLTKRVLGSALDGEITDHVGYDICEDGATTSGPWPDPRYDRPKCLVLDLSTAGSGVGRAAARPGGRVPIGALPHKAPSQS